MSRKLSFEFDVEKFVNASAYLLERCPGVTKMKLAKLLYFADKEHLLNYGRPILGDRYIKMEFGPVPSRGYNLMKGESTAEDQELFDRHISVTGNDISLRASADKRHLSETDIEALDEACKRYGQLTAAQLSHFSHREPAWMNADLNSEMDYRLLFANRTNAAGVEQMAQDDQELKDALAESVFEEILESLRS